MQLVRWALCNNTQVCDFEKVLEVAIATNFFLSDSFSLWVYLGFDLEASG